MLGDGVDVGLREKENGFGVFFGVIKAEDFAGEESFMGDPGAKGGCSSDLSVSEVCATSLLSVVFRAVPEAVRLVAVKRGAVFGFLDDGPAVDAIE